MATRGSFPLGMTLTTHAHLVPRSRMSRSYTSSPPSTCSGIALAFFKYIPLRTQAPDTALVSGEREGANPRHATWNSFLLKLVTLYEVQQEVTWKTEGSYFPLNVYIRTECLLDIISYSYTCTSTYHITLKECRKIYIFTCSVTIVTYVRFPWLNNVSTATTMDGRFLSYATILGG
jgi:hypothetical protein